jgi:hypothetical protein
MSRWFGYAADATPGGSTLDDVSAGGTPVIPAATAFVPVTTAQADPGTSDLDRNDEVRGVRGNAPSEAFASIPTMTFGARAYPELLRKFLRNALGGAPANSGVAPAPIESTIGPLQSGNLPAVIGWLLREGQLDRMTGAVVEELTLNLPVDGEGTIEATLAGLYHQVDDSGTVGALPNAAAGFGGFDDVFRLMDVNAIVKATAPASPSTASPASGSPSTTTSSTTSAPSSAPARTSGSTRSSTGSTGSGTRTSTSSAPRPSPAGSTSATSSPTASSAASCATAEKLVVELTGGPLGTTPAADEMVRLTFFKQAPTGGGAEALQRDGDQVSSYEFTAYVDPTTGKDVEATFVGTAAVV